MFLIVFNSFYASANEQGVPYTTFNSLNPSNDGFECVNVSGNAEKSLYYDEVDAYKSLVWSVKNFYTAGNQTRMQYKLPKKLYLLNGPITIDVSLKILDGEFALGGFPCLPDNTVFGLYQWSNIDILRLSADNNIYVANSWQNYVDNFKENLKLKSDDLKEDFYTFRYVIYPCIGTNKSTGFRFYYKKDADAHWYEPYGEYKLNDTLEQGILPAGTLPQSFEYLYFDIRLLQGTAADNNAKIAFKNISVNQYLDCVSSNVDNGGILSKSYFEVTFNSKIELATINSRTLVVSKDGTSLKQNTDYTAVKKDDCTLQIKFTETPPQGSAYTVTFKGINNRDYYAKLKEILTFNFTAGNKTQLISMYSSGIFVSPYASDSGNGTISNPFLNIESAVAKWKALGAQINIKPAIYLRGGEYKIHNTLYLDDTCSGMTISAYRGENAVVSGAYKIENSQIRSANSLDCDGRLNRDLLKNIIRIDLSKYDDIFRSDNNNEVANCEIVNNGEIQKLAAWPNNGKWDYTGEVTQNSDGTYTFVSSKEKFWKDTASDVMVEGYWYADYQYERGKALSFNDNTGEVTVSQNKSSFSSNRRYRFYNLPEEIDNIGEYYINYDEKAAYLMVDTGEQNNIEITGTTDGVFNIISGADNITVSGITIKNTRGAGIKIYKGSNITVSDCYIYNTGANGITAKKSTKCNITNSYFANNGYISLYLDGGDIPSLTGAGYVVNNCEFEYGGRLVKTYSPFVYTSGVGFEITNNKFYNHPHSAILFYGCENIIKNNVFENVVTETEDAGAIYSRVNPTYRGNVISNNIFKDIKSFKSELEYADVFGIYIDDLLQDVTVSENLFYNCVSPFNFGGGRSNRFTNNAVYNSYEGGGYLTRSNAVKDSLKSNNGYMWTFVNSLRNSYGYSESDWFKKYPNYKKFVLDLDKQNSDSTNTDASVITDGEIWGNVYVSPNANKTNYIKLSSVVSQNGNVSNNYKSTNMNDMATDGTYVTYSTQVKQTGCSEPDILGAGPTGDKPNKPTFGNGKEYTNILSYNGLNIDCTRYKKGTAAESYYDGLITYTPFGTASLTADVLGDEACLELTHNKADFSYNNCFSYVFKPLLSAQSTFEFETGININSDTLGNVGFLAIQGYNEQNPDLSITAAEGLYNCQTQTLKYAGENIPISCNELLNKFVRIKVLLDTQNKKITVYKNIDGVYNRLFEKNVSVIPDYVDRVKYYASNKQNTDDFICRFNNIKVTPNKCAYVCESYSGDEIANLKEYTKDTFCIKFSSQPDYSKLCNIIAAYSADGELIKVINLETASSVNLNKSLFGNDFYIKCYQLNSLKKLTPLGGCTVVK